MNWEHGGRESRDNGYQGSEDFRAGFQVKRARRLRDGN